MEFTKNQIALAVGVLVAYFLFVHKDKNAASVGVATQLRKIDNMIVQQNTAPSMGAAATIRAIDNATLTPANVIADTNTNGIPQYPAQQVYS